MIRIRGTSEAPMKTQGEIEAAVCEGIARFEQQYMGRGPKDIARYLVDDLLVVRLKGVLTAAEQQLVASLPAKRAATSSNRCECTSSKRPGPSWRPCQRTGVKVLSLHHDISTVPGEEVVLFTLATSPLFRELRK